VDEFTQRGLHKASDVDAVIRVAEDAKLKAQEVMFRLDATQIIMLG